MSFGMLFDFCIFPKNGVLAQHFEEKFLMG